MLVLNLPFKALMFLTLMRPSLVLFLVLWLKLVKDFLKVRCRLALLPFLISCLIWLDLVASLPLIKERILDKQASHFVHIPGLSYSGVKSPTECQQSLFESHFASRQSLSDCPVAF